MFIVYLINLRSLILAQLIHIDAYTDDLCIWGGSLDGWFTPGDCHQWLVLREQPAASSVPWEWIWRLHILEKVRVFAWKTCHEALQSVAMLHHRGITLPIICKICGNHAETQLYCLRDCIESLAIWSTLHLDTPSFMAALDFSAWIHFVPREQVASFLLRCWFI